MPRPSSLLHRSLQNPNVRGSAAGRLALKMKMTRSQARRPLGHPVTAISTAASSLFWPSSRYGTLVHTRNHDAFSRSCTSLVRHLFLSRSYGCHRGLGHRCVGSQVKTAVVRTNLFCEILNTPRLLARSAPNVMMKHRMDHVPVHV